MESTKKILKPGLKWEQSSLNGTGIPIFYVEQKVNGREICIAKVELEFYNGNFTDRWMISIFDKVVAVHKGTFTDSLPAILEAERILRKTVLNIVYKLIPDL